MPRLREVVSALLVTPDGRLLIQQRDDNPAILYPGQWTPFGGQVEPDETPRAAVYREMREELELDLPLTLWKTYVDPNRTIPGEVICMHYSYFAHLDRDPAALTQHEGQGRAAFTLDALRALTVAFGQKGLLTEFMESDRPLSPRRSLDDTPVRPSPPQAGRGELDSASQAIPTDALAVGFHSGVTVSPEEMDFGKPSSILIPLAPLAGERG